VAQKVVGKKKAVGLGGQEVHTFGWINFVCIGCLNMSLNFVYVCGFDFVWFWGVCDFGSGRKISGSSIMSEMFVNIWWYIGCTHNMNKSSSGRFKCIGYYTVDHSGKKFWL